MALLGLPGDLVEAERHATRDNADRSCLDAFRLLALVPTQLAGTA